MIYLDTSAIVKLARREAESDALRSWLAAHPAPLVASALARTETLRALQRTNEPASRVLPAVLALLHQFPVSDAILDAAAALPEPTLRTPDTIHLATAMRQAPLLTAFVTYDKRLAAAAAQHGLPVAAPN